MLWENKDSLLSLLFVDRELLGKSRQSSRDNNNIIIIKCGDHAHSALGNGRQQPKLRTTAILADRRW